MLLTMADVVHRERLSATERDAVARLLSAERADGVPNRLESEAWEATATEGAAGFGAWLATEDGTPTAYLQALPGDDDGWQLALAAGDRSERGAAHLGRLVDAALDHVAAHGGGPVELWVTGTTPGHDRMLGERGLAAARSVLQLRRGLPLEDAPSVEVRPFVPGEDEDAWLAVNNRAFAWHPDQGGWDLDDLRQRMAEPWFDPAGFLLHERDGKLAGFCWTKVHAHAAPPMGEIYVIAVDPDFGGRGLGRELTLAGLGHLADGGLTVGMLYVESDNEPARRLYDGMGFTTHHTDRAYRATVTPV